jgi:hypothetical protein
MTNLKYKSIALTLGLISLVSYDLIASIWTHSKSSTMIVGQSNFIKDTIHHVGDLFGGGVVFLVDKTGHHGLICSMSDIKKYQPIEIREQITKIYSQTNNQAARKDLELKIISEDNTQNAKIACDGYTNSNYGTGIFSDWFLPTLDSLDLLYQVKDEINKTLGGCDQKAVDPLAKTYWSDTKFFDERFGYQDWAFDFRNGNRASSRRPPPNMFGIRAIRSF